MAPTKPQTQPVVLVFEQQKSRLNLLKPLTDLGISMEQHTDAKEFLSRIKKQLPSACLIEVHEAGDHSAAMLIKAMNKVLGSKVPVVAIVELSDKEAIAQVIAAGATERIEYPVKQSELVKALSKFFTTAEMKRAMEDDLESPLADLKMPSAVTWFFNEIYPRLVDLNRYLEDIELIEQRLSFYAKHVAHYQAEFIAMIKSLAQGKDPGDLTQALRLYGRDATQLMVVAAGISEITGAGVFLWDSKAARLKLAPDKIIPYGAKALQSYGDDNKHRFIAFSAGLVFDLLGTLADKAADRKTAVRRQLEAGYESALACANASLKRGRSVQDLALAHYIVAVHFMSEAGKAAMALCHADYLEFAGNLEKRKLSPVLRQWVEQEKYGVSSNLMASLICKRAPGLAHAYKAVMFSHTPFLIADSPANKNSFALAQLCAE